MHMVDIHIKVRYMKKSNIISATICKLANTYILSKYIFVFIFINFYTYIYIYCLMLMT